MRSVTRVALAVLAIVAICVLPAEVDAKKKNARKNRAGDHAPMTGSEKVAALDLAVKEGVVQLTSESFAKYVLRPDRPYHLVLLFTALDDKFGCSVCREVQPEFLLLSESYAATKKAKGGDDTGIYFAVVDFDANQESFGVFGMTSAPHIMYIAPDRNADVGERLPARMEMEERNMYNLYASGKKAENLLEFVKMKTNKDFEIQRSKLFLYITVVAVLITLAIATKLVLSNLDSVLKRLRRKRLWMTVSLLFYGLSVSGMVYCIIREPAPYSRERNGKIKLFHPAGRGQFVVEGLVIGAYDILAAVGMIALSQWAIYVKNPALRYPAILACVGCFFFMYRQMIGAYIYKNRWYQGWMGI